MAEKFRDEKIPNTREFQRALEILGNPENFRDGEEEFGKIGEFAWQISFSDPIFR